MEAKLREYRARRRRQELVEKTAEKITNAKRRVVDFFGNMIKINVEEVDATPAITEIPAQEKPVNKRQLEEKHNAKSSRNNNKKNEDEESLIEVNSDISEVESEKERHPESWRHYIMKWTLYTVVWVTLYVYFISLQFGAVFFAVSLLVGIYLNTGTRPKKRGEVSAYSVFNENCESIEGTITPEKLQNEMFFGNFRLF